MTGATKAVAAFCGIGGTCGAAAGGIILSSTETIGSLVKDQVLGTTEEFNSSWKDQHKKLIEYSGELSPELKNIKEKHNDNAREASREALKTWCTNSYSKTYKTPISKANDSLLREVKTYCIQSVKEKLTASISKGTVLTGAGHSNEFKENYKTLKNHDEKKDGILDSELVPLKENSDSTFETGWSKLQMWCDKYHGTPFKGETDLFKNLKKYCIKTTQ
ncbi:hypothetical protein HF1_01980 [Mycoplasma haemofelis str. Langford 1]|uniref:Uncharacterized protein n=1 Tax=Mycoplasma haemofelis (strain Langford 1) TaxID=941640 RepID=E8ZKP0_MYCHL|nr:hypothetical protein [Mycoplasma haemofelis]CBY92206.1 hypothetical protein HF1_01980 [Mycoplasma haemofelis str. Langford 1]